MIKGTTKSGFEYEVDENRLKNMRVLKLLQKMQKNNGTAFLEAITAILGEEQEEKLYEHLENTEGSANVENTVREFAEIIHNAGDALKNL